MTRAPKIKVQQILCHLQSSAACPQMADTRRPGAFQLAVFLSAVFLDLCPDTGYRPAMRFPRSLVLSAALLASVPCAMAAPAEGAGDEMGRFLSDKGLLVQLGDHIGQVRQSVGEKASDLVMNAMGFLGVPYRRGGTSSETGFDCSGFVRAMYQQTVGLILPRSADQQAAATQTIDRSDLRPGDLVFFNTMRRTFSHVGIYIGDNKFIHSPRSGSEVRVEDMRMGYWQTRFNGARRVEAPSAQP